MAKPLTRQQKQINKDLKMINPDADVFTSQEFKNNLLARTIDYMYSDVYNKICNNLVYTSAEEFLTKMTDKEKLLHGRAKVYYDDNYKAVFDNHPEIDIYESTAKVLEIFEISLINQLKDIKYFYSDMETHSFGTEAYIKERLKKWSNYCNVINQAKSFIEDKFPQWSTMTKMDKSIYIRELKSISNAPFMHNTTNLNYFIDFIENYALSQTKKAKANFLLKL